MAVARLNQACHLMQPSAHSSGLVLKRICPVLEILNQPRSASTVWAVNIPSAIRFSTSSNFEAFGKSVAEGSSLARSIKSAAISDCDCPWSILRNCQPSLCSLTCAALSQIGTIDSTRW